MFIHTAEKSLTDGLIAVTGSESYKAFCDDCSSAAMYDSETTLQKDKRPWPPCSQSIESSLDIRQETLFLQGHPCLVSDHAAL